MSKYKIKLIYPEGDEEIIEDEEYDTEADAEEMALYYISCSRQGAEILHMSNPGDYEYDEDTFEDATYEIIEVNK